LAKQAAFFYDQLFFAKVRTIAARASLPAAQRRMRILRPGGRRVNSLGSHGQYKGEGDALAYLAILSVLAIQA